MLWKLQWERLFADQIRNLHMFILCRACVDKLKTTPTPNKNGSYGIKRGGSHAVFLGPYAIHFCRNTLILRDFYAIRTPIVWHILGHILCKHGEWGWSELFSMCAICRFIARRSFRHCPWQSYRQGWTCSSFSSPLVSVDSSVTVVGWCITTETKP